MSAQARCFCGHVAKRHIADHGLCLARKCFCLIFRSEGSADA